MGRRAVDQTMGKVRAEFRRAAGGEKEKQRILSISWTGHGQETSAEMKARALNTPRRPIPGANMEREAGAARGCSRGLGDVRSGRAAPGFGLMFWT